MRQITFDSRIVLFFAVILFGYQFICANALQNPNSKYVLITFKFVEVDFAEGETAKIRSVIRNISKENIRIVINRWDKFYGFPINLRNGDKTIAVRGDHPQIGGMTTIELAPDMEFEPYFEFGKLKAGLYKFDYKIAASVMREPKESSEFFEMNSPTFKFQMNPND